MTQPIPNIQADAIIILQGKDLKYVSPSLSKKIKTGQTATIVWKIHPPGKKTDVTIKLKDINKNPFSDWPNGSAHGDDKITGTIDESKIPQEGYLEFEYSVEDANNKIDPGAIIYR